MLEKVREGSDISKSIGEIFAIIRSLREVIVIKWYATGDEGSGSDSVGSIELNCGRGVTTRTSRRVRNGTRLSRSLFFFLFR